MGKITESLTSYLSRWQYEFEKMEKEKEAIRKQYKDLAEEILGRVKANLPDLHFKACPWCGKEPYLKVDIPLYSTKDVPKQYRLELHGCEHLDLGHLLGYYNIGDIPSEPTCPNKDYRWDISWNGGTHPGGRTDHDVPFENFPLKFFKTDDPLYDNGCGYEDRFGNRYNHITDWCYAVMKYQNYLSDDYPYQCCKCHKKWRGYESYGDEVSVDGKTYCRACADIWDGKYARYDVIRDALNIDSLYIQDNEPRFYTSVESCISCHDLKKEDCYSVFIQSDRKQGADGLSGSISGTHWEIWKYNKDPKLSKKSHWNMLGYVFTPADKDRAILEEMRDEQ